MYFDIFIFSFYFQVSSGDFRPPCGITSTSWWVIFIPCSETATRWSLFGYAESIKFVDFIVKRDKVSCASLTSLVFVFIVFSLVFRHVWNELPVCCVFVLLNSIKNSHWTNTFNFQLLIRASNAICWITIIALYFSQYVYLRNKLIRMSFSQKNKWFFLRV